MAVEVDVREKLRSEAFSSRIEREILKILYDYREVNPLRPKDILEYLPSEIYSSSGSKLAYHLDKLCRAGLVERKPVGRKLTWYTLTDEGTLFFEKLPRTMSTDDIAHFLANVIAPYVKGASEVDILNALRSILMKKEAPNVGPGRDKEKTD